MSKLYKQVFLIFSAVSILLFCYFRLLPIYFQTVPYTFDQGRDFLRVADLVSRGDIALVGPTTGVPGIFHGVWWYYFLSIPYLLSGGSPMSFYLYVFIVALVLNLAFSYFLSQKYDKFVGLIFFMLVALSPYFIYAAFFVSNNTFALPFFLLFLYCYARYTDKESLSTLFILGLSLALLFEAEVALGVFVYPAFLISLLVLRQLKTFFGSKKKMGSIFLGVFIGHLPRLLLEIKTQFAQTKVALKLITTPSTESVKTFNEVFLERFHLLQDLYQRLFADNILLYVVFLTVLGFGTYYSLLILKKKQKNFFLFILFFLTSFFFLSLLYKKVVFANYYEGIPYLFAILIAVASSSIQSSKNTIAKGVLYFALSLLLATNVVRAYQDTKKDVKLEGLREHIHTVGVLYDEIGEEKESCIKVYTPPVIPHTYNYLFRYYESTGKPKITSDFINRKCWFILEKDECKFLEIEQNEKRECLGRIERWKQDQKPQSSKRLKVVTVNPKVTLELWENQ